MRSSIRKGWLALGLGAALALGVGLAVAADQKPADKPPAQTATEAQPDPEAKKPGPDQTGSAAKGEPSGQAKPANPPAVPRIAPDEGC